MDKMEVEAKPPGVGHALALVDAVNGESIPNPSFRDIVGGGIVADQRNYIIDSLDVSLTEEDVRNRVHAVWSPIRALNIIDLDNDYYLIRFAMDADYDKPWSKEFSTATCYPKHILAWLRLPGLPCRGHFPRLVVVVNLDRPLIFGIVIDGSFQAIEYEGLLVICFGCGKYGHSKEVCGQTKAVTIPHAPGRKSEPPVDGWFGPWMQHNTSGIEQDFGREPNTQGMGAIVRVSSVVGEAVVSAQAGVEGVVHSTCVLREVVQVNPVMGVAMVMWNNHVGRRSLLGQGLLLRVRSCMNRLLYMRINIHWMYVPQLVVADSASKFASFLNMGTMVVISSVMNDVNNIVVGDANYEPRDENVSIEVEPWPMPRVSGLTADNFIRRARFDYSYPVEANGFSGGIWVMWKNIVNIDVVVVDNQFIHGSCFVIASQQRFFITFIYAIPDSSRKSALWGRLRALDPGLAHPWILGGDFNVICSSAKRHDGSVRRSRVCPRFCDFLFQSGLLDIGFSVLRFTWQRGYLSQRLDKCLCNGSDFDRLLRESWDSDVAMFDNLMSFQGKNRLWNKEVFGHIGKRKARVFARIKGVELALDRAESLFLLELE
ncbi:hypothetical protein GQ457_11G022210 [Hibiscus cannabinus]